MDTGKTRDMVARFRELLARGATLEKCETKLKRPRSTLHRIAEKENLPRRRKGLPKSTERKLNLLLAREESERVICRILDVSKGMIWRRKLRRLKRLGLPRKVAPHRCPGPCGKIVVYVPCMICRAMQAREATAKAQTA